MSQIFSGQHEVYYVCNHKGCETISRNYYYFERSTEADNEARLDGWHISRIEDKSYCPEHGKQHYSEGD